MTGRLAPSAWRTVATAALSAWLASSCASAEGSRAVEGPEPAVVTASGDERSAHCSDGEQAWSAAVVDDLDAGTLRITTLEHATGWHDRSPWLVVTTRPDTRERVERPVQPADVHSLVLEVVEAPRVVSPDRRCTIYLAPPAPRGTVELVVVGDSLAAGLVATADERAALVHDAQVRGLHVIVDGQSGAPWAPLPDEGANLDDELRGARSIGDDVVLATVIGANDAILAALTPEQGKHSQRERTDGAITSTIDDARADGRCLVVTTPPDVAIEAFGLQEDYAVEAQRVGDLLRSYGSSSSGVVVVDFAAASRSRHLPDGTPGDWFAANDQLHPNADGSAALRSMLLDAARRCPPVS